MLLRCAFLLLIVLFSVAASALELTYKDLNAKDFSLSAYKGKWLVVNYWATWCPPCLEEIPELVFFHEKHKDKGVVVIGVNIETDLDSAFLKDFAEENMITYPILRNQKNAVLGQMKFYPTTFIISPQGVMSAKKVGPITRAYLEKELRLRKSAMVE